MLIFLAEAFRNAAGNHISNSGSEGLRPTEVYTEAGNRERQTEKQERDRQTEGKGGRCYLWPPCRWEASLSACQ